MFTEMMPTIVSRTPQRLMFVPEGEAPRVRTTRIMAAEMTKKPEQMRRPMTSFFLRGTWRVQRRGRGMQRRPASVLGGVR